MIFVSIARASSTITFIQITSMIVVCDVFVKEVNTIASVMAVHNPTPTKKKYLEKVFPNKLILGLTTLSIKPDTDERIFNGPNIYNCLFKPW
jgi:hypothetical protein